ncbi:MAG: hypothetical protein WKF57_16235 [Nakamurella sp.]
MSARLPDDDRDSTDALAGILAGAFVHPEAPALSDGTSRPLTVGQLASRVRAVAGGLSRQGFGEGEQLRLALNPSVTSVTLALAAVLTGGSAVLDPGGRPHARLSGAPNAWVAADSMALVSATLSRHSASRHPSTGNTAANASPHHGVGWPSPDRTIHVGAWLPGVPRTALSLRRLASGAMFDAAVPTSDHPAVTVLRTTGAVTHTRVDLGLAVRWLSRQVGLESVDRLVTDDPVLGLAALSAGAQWQIGSATPGRRDLVKVSLVGITGSQVEQTCAALTAAGSTAGVVVRDGPISSDLARHVVAERRLHVLSGREGLLPVAVVSGADLVSFDGPGALLGEVVPGVRLLIDGDRILTRGHRRDGSLGAVDTGLRGRFAGTTLVADAP